MVTSELLNPTLMGPCRFPSPRGLVAAARWPRGSSWYYAPWGLAMCVVPPPSPLSYIVVLKTQGFGVQNLTKDFPWVLGLGTAEWWQTLGPSWNVKNGSFCTPIFQFLEASALPSSSFRGDCNPLTTRTSFPSTDDGGRRYYRLVLAYLDSHFTLWKYTRMYAHLSFLPSSLQLSFSFL